MVMMISSVLCVFVYIIYVVTGVDSCQCKWHPQKVFLENEFVLKVHVDEKNTVGRYLMYTVTVLDTFKDQNKNAVIGSKLSLNGGYSMTSCTVDLQEGTDRIVAGYTSLRGELRLSFCSVVFSTPSKRMMDGLKDLYDKNDICKPSMDVVVRISPRKRSSTTCYRDFYMDSTCLMNKGICALQNDGSCEWNGCTRN